MMQPILYARIVFLAAACGVANLAVAAQRTQSFDTDPGWTGVNNRVLPKSVPTIKQDFGYAATNIAGKGAGEMGGTITRASEPAFYADKITPKTLDDKLSASGTFALTKTTGGAGIFFGFFRADQPGAGGRPIASLGLHMDCERGGARLAVRLITGQNQSCGTFITPYLPGKFRPTPIRNDGTRYAWTLDYDPAAAGGRGRFTFTIASDAHKPGELQTDDMLDAHRQEAQKRFPSTTTFSVDLPEGYRQQETTFDHFGLMNMMKAGGQVTIHFDDLKYLDRSQDFSRDPKWDASGNRRTYDATDVGGAHNFGFSDTNHAGGNKGEIGGTFWRTDKWGYYADKVKPLTFDDRIEARGKVVLAVGAPDADMCFGYFRIRETQAPVGATPASPSAPTPGTRATQASPLQPAGVDGAAPNRAGDFLGIKVGGPTRVGHYFLPTFCVSEQVRGLPNNGPVMHPGKVYAWSLLYDPLANNGNGVITATLGSESVTLNLKPGQKTKAKDARLDHFGMFSIGPGGQIVKLYIDDLQYTPGPSD